METLGERLEFAIELRGTSQSEVAREVGLKPQTIQGICSGKQKTSSKLVDMARFLRVELDWLRDGKGPMEPTVQAPGLESPTHVATSGYATGPRQAEVIERSVPDYGDVRAGSWFEVDDVSQDEPAQVKIRVEPNHQGMDLFAVTARGSSMNKVFPDGTQLICAKIENGMDVIDGDYVVVERIRAQGGESERTVKQVKIDGKKVELWPRSHDKKWQSPLVYKDLSKNFADVRVVGVVLYVAQRNLK